MCKFYVLGVVAKKKKNVYRMHLRPANVATDGQGLVYRPALDKYVEI